MSFEKTLGAIETAGDGGFDIQVLDNPRVLVFRNFFGKDINRRILDEAIALEPHFKEATIGEGKVNKDKRSNRVCYYDEVFANGRKSSALLTALEDMFKSVQMHELVSSAGAPFCDFAGTTTHETQVSRYGDTGQKYEWHIDRFGMNRRRHITLVYYFFEEPKAFEGGEILVSDGVINKDKIVNEATAGKHAIVPENDMAVMFSSVVPHCVTPCTSPPEFSKGRFSMNCWIGFNPEIRQAQMPVNVPSGEKLDEILAELRKMNKKGQEQ